MTGLFERSKVEEKMRSDDRILVIKDVDPKRVDKGFLGASLSDEKNTLHAIREPWSNLWYLKYTHGILPGPFKQKFTSFERLIKFLNDYLDRRGLKLERVEDCYDWN